MFLDVQLSHHAWQLVAGLASLQYLNAGFSSISDTTLPILAPLTSLTHLDVDSTQISDPGLNTIGRFAKLQNLCLSDTRYLSVPPPNDTYLWQVSHGCICQMLGC